MIALPKQGKLTQGTIFCGGYAEGYEKLPVWGFVITARCDTAHNKVPVVNYLPMVRFEDWLRHQGGLAVVERVYIESKGKLKNILLQSGLSPSLLDVHEPTLVAKTNFPEPSSADFSKKAEKQRKDAALALALADCIELTRNIIDGNGADRESIEKILTESDVPLKAIVTELLTHKLSGYYYVPTIGELTEMGSTSGYVVLLREVRHLPREQASKLSEGMPRPDPPAGGGSAVCFDVFDFAYPVAETLSPWVEHIMQIFCNLFGRVGVADIDRGVVARIINCALLKGAA